MASGSRGLLAVVVVVMVVAVLGVPPATGLLAPRLADDPARGVATAGRPCATYPGSLGQLRGRHDHVLATLVRARARVVAASATAATGARQLQQAPYLALGGLRQRRDHADRLAAITLIVSPRSRIRTSAAPAAPRCSSGQAGRLHGHLGDPFRFPRVDPGQAGPRDEERRHVLDVVPLPLRALLLCSGLGIAHPLTRHGHRLNVHHGRTIRPHLAPPSPSQPTSRDTNVPVLQAPTNSPATLPSTRTRPALRRRGGQQHAPPPSSHHHCLVHLKIARDAPRLLGFAIYVWTIPAQVVQIYIAISASAASGRVERLQRAEPGPSSRVVPAAPFVGPNGRRLRSAWHPVAIMRRRGRVHGRRLKLRGAAALAGSSSSNADATSRQPPAEEPHSSQRSNNARIRASPRGALRAGSRTSGRKKVPAAPAPSVRGATKSLAPGSRSACGDTTGHALRHSDLPLRQPPGFIKLGD